MGTPAPSVAPGRRTPPCGQDHTVTINQVSNHDISRLVQLTSVTRNLSGVRRISIMLDESVGSGCYDTGHNKWLFLAFSQLRVAARSD